MRRPSPRALLARAGLEAADLERLERGGLATAGEPDEAALALLAEAADPSAALDTLIGLSELQPGLAARVRSDPAWLGRVVAVAGASRPLGQLIARDRDATEALATLDGVEVESTARAVEDAVRGAAGTDAQAAGIAAIRRGATADIAARDLTGAADVATVARELSNLAEAVLTGTLAAVQAELVDGGVPSARVAVIGMGKLGGEELNYVSDVDVMFVHEPVEGADEDAAAVEARATVTRLLELLNASTTMGRAYEVDPTLRPEGRQGPITRTVASYVAYWERWARTWEFQALLKARPVAGDRPLGAHLLEQGAAFLWPERLDPEVVAEVREMKARIEAKPEVRRDGGRQIKLGPGGLRDIEFAVQLLQLVHGRADATLRATGTLPALAALAAAGYVDEDDATAFADAYRSLRTIEHRLQLVNERRTHTVPEDPARQEHLARALGYRASDDREARSRFLADLARIQGEVRDLHAKLFYRPLLESYAVLPARAAEVSVPGRVSAMGDAAATERLAALGFRDASGALRDVRSMTGGVSRRALALRAALPALLQVLQDAPDPDGGLTAFRELVEAQGETSPLLGHLRDQPSTVDLLGRVLGTSRLAGELLVGQPQGVEWLTDPELQSVARTRGELVGLATKRLSWQDATPALRRFKRLELLRVVLRDLAGATTVGGVGEELTAIAEACLEGALEAVLAARQREHGALPVRLAIIGMGKLGGHELGYPSDLDVLFVHEALPGADEDASTALALSIASEVMGSLSAITTEGSAFDIDADLRPEGRNGALSRTLTSYVAYWERWAEPWEHQALTRARAVAGDVGLGERFVAAADAFAHPDHAVEERLVAMRRMKARIEKERVPRRVDASRHLKLGPGGSSDVEWTVQLLQQLHGRRFPSLRTPSTMAAIDVLQDLDVIEHRDADWLREGWRFVTALRNRMALLKVRDVDVMPSGRAQLELLARALGRPRGGWQQLEEDRLRHARHVRSVAERLFYGAA
ncbi:MAG: hypothetical protein RLZZ272_1561 [Actinomycetota bacterium]